MDLYRHFRLFFVNFLSFIYSIHCWLYRIYYWHIFILWNKTYCNCLVCQSGIMLLCWTATTKFCILIYDTNINVMFQVWLNSVYGLFYAQLLFFKTIKRILSDSLCCWIHKIFVIFVESSKTISCLIGIYYMCEMWNTKLWSFLGLQASLEVGHVLIFIITTNHNGGPNLKLSAGAFHLTAFLKHWSYSA